MREADILLMKYLEEAKKALTILAKKYPEVITEEIIWQILIGHFECFDIPTEIVFQKLTSPQIIELIDSFFKKNGIALFTIELEGIFLESNADAIKKADVKYGGAIWRVHKKDADPFPSNPHAHCYADNVKLHLGNGDLYRNTNKLNEHIRKKDLIALRELIKQRLPSLKLPRMLV